MMKALLSTSTFPIRADDGLPRYIYDLAEALNERFEILVLAPDAPGAALREKIGSVDVRRFPYFRPRRLQALAYGHGMADNFRESFWAKLQPLPYLLAQARALRKLVREESVEVVNSHWMVPQGLSAALARGSSKRFHHVVTLHGGDAYLLRKMPFGRELARFIYRRTDAIFAVSSNVRDNLDQVLGFPSNAVIRPVGVHLERFRRKEEAVELPFSEGYLLFVGRLHEIKGIRYLLQAMPRVLERYPGMGLVIVGYGPEEPALREEAQQIGLNGQVRFTGRKPHADIVRLLQGCRAAVVPSIVDDTGRTEGTPTVVIEALASGARIVASSVGGIRDVIRHEENGWLCAPRDADDLARKLLVALEDPPGSAVEAGARETADTFDWSSVAPCTPRPSSGSRTVPGAVPRRPWRLRPSITRDLRTSVIFAHPAP